MQSFRSLIDNEPVVEYLYGSIPVMHGNICARMPYLVDWEVIQIIATIMKCIFRSIVLNQCYGKKWLLSYDIVDLVQIYTYCSGDDDNEDVSKHPYSMVE